MFERCHAGRCRRPVEEPYKQCAQCRETLRCLRRHRALARRCVECGASPLVTETLCAACRRTMLERNRRRRGLPPLPSLVAQQKA